MRHAWMMVLFLMVMWTTLPTVGAGVPSRCGTERWDVKTLTDAQAGSVLMTPKSGTITALRTLQAPAQVTAILPRQSFERQAYRVVAKLIGAKREADSDYHLVIADPSDVSKTMIAEIPDPACMDGSRAKAAVATARAAFEKKYGVPGAWRRIPGSPQVTITGVLFFDKLHGQTGVAPNGAELHPVLEIR